VLNGDSCYELNRLYARLHRSIPPLLDCVDSMKNLNLKLDKFQYYEPRQDRAKLTFKLVLTTAMHTIEHEGIAALNTNRVADDCDVNISTLYHYFPNKDAIVYALYKT
jgi:hypothetical protein